MPTAAELLEEAERAPVGGWDFSWIANRSRVSPLPLDFRTIAESAFERAEVALDMGTGGGEFLATLRTGSAFVVATESWLPNAPIARDRLGALGVSVLQDEGAADNIDQSGVGPTGRLPFRDECFDLVLNRHEAFVAAEVTRVLCPGAEFITQQADNGSAAFHALLGIEAPDPLVFRLEHAVAQIETAGLTVVESGSTEEVQSFSDIGALAWYLRRVPWTIPGFTVEKYRDALTALHDRDLTVKAERFWLRCRRLLPASPDPDKCGECAFEYALREAEAAAAAIRAGVTEVAKRLRSKSADLRTRRQPEVWSPLEYGCHLRDVLLVQRERVLTARRVKCASFEPMGRDERVDHDGYAEQEPNDVARQLTDAAQLFAHVLSLLGEDEWERTVIYSYPTRTERSLRWVAVHTLHEVRHHLLDMQRQLHGPAQ